MRTQCGNRYEVRSPGHDPVRVRLPKGPCEGGHYTRGTKTTSKKRTAYRQCHWDNLYQPQRDGKTRAKCQRHNGKVKEQRFQFPVSELGARDDRIWIKASRGNSIV